MSPRSQQRSHHGGPVRWCCKLAVKVIQMVNVTGHAKNRWSLLSSFSPQNKQLWVIPHCLIRTPVDNLSLKANQTMKVCRGTYWGDQTKRCHGTSWFLSLIWSHVLKVEKWSLKSSSPCLQSITSFPASEIGFPALSSHHRQHWKLSYLAF